MKTSIRTNSLALVGTVALALVSSSAKATLTYTPGDLFVGFRDTSGTASQDYLVDIGQASQFTPAGSSFPLGQDPNNRNIRLAPTFPGIAEVTAAMEGVTTCVLLAAAEKLAEN